MRRADHRLPPSCADCLEIWKPQPPGPSGSVQACIEFALHFMAIPTLLCGVRILTLQTSLKELEERK
jgi:hypothetical protein